MQYCLPLWPITIFAAPCLPETVSFDGQVKLNLSQLLKPHSDILVKFFIGKFGISCVHPDVAGDFAACSAVFQPLVIDDTIIDRTCGSFRCMKYLPAACIAAHTHASVAVAGRAICSTYADILLFGLLIFHSVSPPHKICFINFFHTSMNRRKKIVYFRHYIWRTLPPPGYSWHDTA